MMRIGRLTSADETGLGGNEFQMGFVTQPFGLGNGQNALIDPGRQQVWGRRDDRGIGRSLYCQFTQLSPIPGHEVLVTTVVAGWPWNRGRVVSRKSELLTKIGWL